MDTHSTQLKEFRCLCGKLLFRGLLLSSVVEIKCTRCGRIKTVKVPQKNLIHQNVFTVLLDTKGSVISVSDNALTILGYTAEELVGVNIREINPGIRLSVYRRLWITRSRDGDLNGWKRAMYRTKKGGFIPVASQVMLFESGGAPLFLFTVDTSPDVPDTKSPFEGISFGDSKDEIFFEVDLAGHCVRAGGNAMDFLGYDVGVLEGKPLVDFCSLTHGDAKYGGANILLTHSNGSLIKFESYFMPIVTDRFLVGQRVFCWAVDNS